MQVPLQHGMPPLHATPPGRQVIVTQRWFMQNRGAPQSALVRQTPPSFGFGMQVPYTHPKEQHSASAEQKDA